MTNIPVVICRSSSNKVKRYYLKKKRFFQILYCISEICMKFKIFGKKDEYSSLIISEILNPKKVVN